MQPPPRGSSGGGLARYRSAPATWLEALLESDGEEEQQQQQPQPPPLLNIPEPPLPPPPNADEVDLELLESTAAGGLTNFLRMNSSPAEFLSLLNDSDGYYSIPPTSYDDDDDDDDNYQNVVSQSKRAREAEDFVDKKKKLSPSSATATPLVKIEKLQGQIGGSLDVEMDKLLEESVMCRVRAKRGCATHPRSIAERERRTRISDRIRKLQELVPNMDKQTNTADMLDEAVAYVKFLQKQIQELTEHQKNCKCLLND